MKKKFIKWKEIILDKIKRYFYDEIIESFFNQILKDYNPMDYIKYY